MDLGNVRALVRGDKPAEIAEDSRQQTNRERFAAIDRRVRSLPATVSGRYHRLTISTFGEGDELLTLEIGSQFTPNPMGEGSTRDLYSVRANWLSNAGLVTCEFLALPQVHDDDETSSRTLSLLESSLAAAEEAHRLPPVPGQAGYVAPVPKH